MTHRVQPGSTLGVLGSGQLGRMFAIAARRLGYRIHVFSPGRDTPCGHVSDLEIQAAYDDLDAVAEFAKGVDVVTFEFENVLLETVNAVERFAPVRPAGNVLHMTQQRLREKTFLRSAGIPIAPFREIRSIADLAESGPDDFPAVLKTTAWGYDGKGQIKINSRDEIESAWAELDCDEAVLEQFIDFECELSVVAVRGQDGDFVHYGPIANSHRNHILDVSVTPMALSKDLAEEAVSIARTIVEQLEVVGVLCVEFFLTQSGKLLVNELAPRPHNSGHLTIDGFATCQFEQQVRSVCGLPLGAATLLQPAAMANLLGEVWDGGEPRWEKPLAMPNVSLHLYGKKEARSGRKMGHLTALGENAEIASKLAVAARESLQSHPRSD